MKNRSIRSLPIALLALIALIPGPTPAPRADPAPAPENPQTLPLADAAGGAKSAQLGRPAVSNFDLLRREIEGMLKENEKAAGIGIHIVDERDTLVLFDCNGREARAPGAAQMLLTAAAALNDLGPEFRFKTTLSYTGSIEDGILDGNLVAAGTGDPCFGMGPGGAPGDPAALLVGWAKQLRAIGVRKVTGGVIGDDNYFDDELESPTWPLEMRGESDLAQISALSLNGGCLDVAWRCGWRRGKQPKVRTAPKTAYAHFHNGVVTASHDTQPRVVMRRDDKSSIITSTGFLPVKSTHQARATVHNPTAFFATVLRETLVENRITITAPNGLDIDDLADPSVLATTRTLLGEYESPPLAEMLKTMLGEPRNLYAEALLKTLGKAKRNEGSFSAGAAVLREYLQRCGLGAIEASLADGSGLSRNNSLAPQILTGLLTRMAADPNASVFRNALAKPGREGALVQWFTEADSASTERIEAVGVVNDRNCVLAGYAATQGGMPLAFAFMNEDPNLSPKEAKALFERLALLLTDSKIRSYAP